MVDTTNETIAKLTATNAELTAEVRMLREECARLRRDPANTTAMPEQNAAGPTEASTADGLPMEMNSQGTPCPVRYGRERNGQMILTDKIFFADKQYCKTCEREVWHLPRFCPKR